MHSTPKDYPNSTPRLLARTLTLHTPRREKRKNMTKKSLDSPPLLTTMQVVRFFN